MSNSLHQAPLFKGFSRQEYWSALHALLQVGSSLPGDQTHGSALAGSFFTTNTTAINAALIV